MKRITYQFYRDFLKSAFVFVMMHLIGLLISYSHICSLQYVWWLWNFTYGYKILCYVISANLPQCFFLAQARSEYLEESRFVLPVQINGKTRGTILVDKACSEDDVFQIAASDEKLSKYLAGKGIRKRIYVPGRILNVILDQQKARTW